MATLAIPAASAVEHKAAPSWPIVSNLSGAAAAALIGAYLILPSLVVRGATNIYSGEFYDLARRRLRPGAVLQQWLQIQHISPRENESVIRYDSIDFPVRELPDHTHQARPAAAGPRHP
jgi:hypothetical protein